MGIFKPAKGDIDAAALAKSGNDANEGIWGICGIGNGVPFAPKFAPDQNMPGIVPSGLCAGLPSERHAFIQVSNICCIPAVAVSPCCCVASDEVSVREEVEERFDAAIPAFDRWVLADWLRGRFIAHVGDCSQPRHALSRGEEHSCSPSQDMSMLVPDFAAVRYFFNYRFPHVFSAVCKAGRARDVIKCKTSPECRACRVLAQPDWHVEPDVFMRFTRD